MPDPRKEVRGEGKNAFHIYFVEAPFSNYIPDVKKFSCSSAICHLRVRINSHDMLKEKKKKK